MSEKTCALIKPDVTGKNVTGKVISMIEEAGFNIVQMKKMTMSQELAEQFYAVHAERPFFNDLVTFMTSGPIIAMCLEKDGAIGAWRDLMGETNPENAAQGTIRALYGSNIQENGTHGSDSAENAQTELGIIFSS